MPARLTRRRWLSAVGLVGLAAGLDLGATGCSGSAAENRVSFLNWQDYVDPALLDDFTKQTGLAVGYETYESNDELERRLLSAAVTRKGGRRTTTFDLVVPSENLFARLRDADALQELDRDVVTDTLLASLAPAMTDLADDPGNRYAVPWATGTTGIGYSRSAFPDGPPTWDVFGDESFSGRMSLLDEQREAFAAALFALGEDINTTDPGVLAAAEERLTSYLPFTLLNSATYLDGLADGTLVAAQGFNTDVLQAAQRNPDLAFTIPAAGGTTWVDLLCIPTDAPNPEGANRLIAFYLDPEHSAANAEFNLVDTGNEAARDLVPPALLADPAVFPPPDVVATLVAIEDLGDQEQLYDDAWQRVRGD